MITVHAIQPRSATPRACMAGTSIANTSPAITKPAKSLIIMAGTSVRFT